MKKNEQSLRDLWDTIKHTNISPMGVPRSRGEKGAERIFEELIADPQMWKKTGHYTSKKLKILQVDKLKEIHTETHNQTVESQR